MNKTMKLLAGFAIASFAALLVFAWFYENAVPHINLLISMVGFIILPLLIWQFGSVKADEKREKRNKESTLSLIFLDVVYLLDSLSVLQSELKDLLQNFDKYEQTYAKYSAANAPNKPEMNELVLALSTTRIFPGFNYAFGFTKRDLIFLSKDDFELFNILFAVYSNTVNLNEDLGYAIKDMRRSIYEAESKYQDESLFKRYAVINKTYSLVFHDCLRISSNIYSLISKSALPKIREYVYANFDKQLYKNYENIAPELKNAPAEERSKQYE